MNLILSIFSPSGKPFGEAPFDEPAQIHGSAHTCNNKHNFEHNFGEHLTDLDCIVGADLCLFTRWGCVINKCSSARACVCFSNHETRKPLNFVL